MQTLHGLQTITAKALVISMTVAAASSCNQGGPPPIAAPTKQQTAAANAVSPETAPSQEPSSQTDEAPSGDALRWDDLPLPEGELLADTIRDLKPAEATGADASATGQWSFYSSETPNPWDSASELRPISDTKRISPIRKLPKGVPQPRAKASIERSESKGLVLHPAGPHASAVVRWRCGAEGQCILQVRVRRLHGGDDEPVTMNVFVDGLLLTTTRLPEGSIAAVPLEIKATVLDRSLVDFVITQDEPENAAMERRPDIELAMRAIRTSDDDSSITLAQSLRDEVAQKLHAAPVRPLPKDADVSQLVSNAEVRTAWWRERFLKQLAPNAPSDVRHFLDQYCERLASVQDAPSDTELFDQGRKLLETHGDQALVHLAVAGAARVVAGSTAKEVLAESLGRCVSLLESPDPSPLQAASFYRSAAVAAVDPAARHKFNRKAAAELARAAAAKDMTDRDRRMLARVYADALETAPLNEMRYEVVHALREADGDPWLRRLVLIREHRRMAWEARGAGDARRVTEDMWALFRLQMYHAQQHVFNAWKIDPDLPEPAVEMIQIAMAASGGPGETERFWFDEAVAADFAYWEAYAAYAWALRPRWGGSHELMFGLAKECLDTGRFDTNIPNFYHQIVAGIASERGGWKAVLTTPGVYEGYVQLLEGIASHSGDDKTRRLRKTQIVAAAFLAGKTDEARRRLKELGDHADSSGPALFGLVFSNLTQALSGTTARTDSYFPDDPSDAVAVAFSHDAKRLLVGSASGRLSIWNIETRKLEEALSRQGGPLTCLEPSSDKARFVTGTEAGTAIVWDAKGLAPSNELTLDEMIHAAAWSTDGQTIALASGPKDEVKHVVLWDLSSGQKTTQPLFAPTPIGKIAYSADGKGLLMSRQKALPGDLNQLTLWDLENSKIASAIRPFRQFMTAYRLSADASRMVLGGVELYSTPAGDVLGAEIRSMDPGASRKFQARNWLPGKIDLIEFLPDGQQVVAAGDQGILIWNSYTGTLEGMVRTPLNEVRSLAVSSGGERVAVVDGVGITHVWQLNSGKLGWHVEGSPLAMNLGPQLRQMEFVAGGQLLVTESPFGGLVVWSRPNGYQGQQLLPPERASLGQFPLPDGRRLMRAVSVGRNQKELQIVDINNGNMLKTLVAANQPQPTAIAISASGNRIGIAHADGALSLFDGATLEPLADNPIKIHPRGVRMLAFSGDGSHLATTSDDKQASWWDMSAVLESKGALPQGLATFSGGRSNADIVVVSPDGSLVALASEETDVFESKTGKLLFSVPGTNPTFSPDSQLLATGGIAPQFNEAKVWDAHTGEQKAALTGGHRTHILCMTFGPDSKFLLTGDAEGWIRAWDSTTGVRLGELP